MARPFRRISVPIRQIIYERCQAPGCSSFKSRVSNFCAKHCRNKHRFGSPFVSYRITPGFYKAERREVAKFYKRYALHPGVQTALAWIEMWLHSGSSSPDASKTEQHIERLRQGNVTPLQVLCETTALYLCVERQPWLLKAGDGLALSYQLGLSTLHLAALHYRRSSGAKKGIPLKPSSMVRREIGETVRMALVPLWANACRAIQAAQMRDPQQKQDLRVAFDDSIPKPPRKKRVKKETTPTS